MALPGLDPYTGSDVGEPLVEVVQNQQNRSSGRAVTNHPGDTSSGKRRV